MQPTAEEKVRERRLRRAALRKGLHLRKSNKLDPDHPEFQKWWVVVPPKDRPELWRWLGRELTHRDGITLEEAVAFVESYRIDARPHVEPAARERRRLNGSTR